MNIMWKIETVLKVDGTKTTVKVAPTQVWEGINVSDSILNHLRGTSTAHITYNNQIFKDIPINWYLIEN